MKNLITICLLSMFVALVACDDATDEMTTAGEEATAGEESTAGEEATVTAPSIVGMYVDNYMGNHVITDTTWTQTYEGSAPSTFNFVSVNNDAGFLIAQNGEMNGFAPNLFSRFDWVEQDGALWYCQIAYEAETAEAAEMVTSSDASDPTSGGCGESPWTSLTMN